MADNSRDAEIRAVEAALFTLDPLTRQRSGLDLYLLDRRLVSQAVADHMTETGAAGLSEYFEILRDSAVEIDRLTERLAVGETWFFRDAGAFAFLNQIAVGWHTSRKPLRVLSLPCSSGEEAYSIAMQLFDSGMTADRFCIIAADISATAMARATEGRFLTNSFRSSDLGFRDRYFTPDDDGFSISPAILDAVSFSCGNVLNADWVKRQGSFDVVFCRNLIIYFRDDARRRLLHNVEQLLAADGILFVGAAEAGLFVGPGYTAAGDASSFAFRKTEIPTTPERPQRKLSPTARSRRQKRESTFLTAASVTAKTDAATTAAGQPSQPPVAATEPQIEGNDALEQAELHANRGELDQATRLITGALDEDGGNPRAYFLLGVVHLAQGDEEEAENLFNKALYLDPQYRDAIHHLSALAEHRGDEMRMLALNERARKLNSQTVESSGQS